MQPLVADVMLHPADRIRVLRLVAFSNAQRKAGRLASWASRAQHTRPLRAHRLSVRHKGANLVVLKSIFTGRMTVRRRATHLLHDSVEIIHATPRLLVSRKAGTTWGQWVLACAEALPLPSGHRGVATSVHQVEDILQRYVAGDVDQVRLVFRHYITAPPTPDADCDYMVLAGDIPQVPLPVLAPPAQAQPASPVQAPSAPQGQVQPTPPVQAQPALQAQAQPAPPVPGQPAPSAQVQPASPAQAQPAAPAQAQAAPPAQALPAVPAHGGRGRKGPGTKAMESLRAAGASVLEVRRVLAGMGLSKGRVSQLLSGW